MQAEDELLTYGAVEEDEFQEIEIDEVQESEICFWFWFHFGIDCDEILSSKENDDTTEKGDEDDIVQPEDESLAIGDMAKSGGWMLDKKGEIVKLIYADSWGEDQEYDDDSESDGFDDEIDELAEGMKESDEDNYDTAEESEDEDEPKVESKVEVSARASEEEILRWPGKIGSFNAPPSKIF